jgi:hypothetical protein
MATLAETGSSVAAGAIAVGRPEDIAKRGISMGFSTNRETMDEAKTRSLKLCANSGSLISGILCEVVATFENKCVAVAIDPAEQTPGFGWSVADTEQASKDNALSNCQATQGFPWDPALWEMVCTSNGGVIAAAIEALRTRRVSGSLSSGLHHARRARGAGFCTFNGLVLAARAALDAGAPAQFAFSRPRFRIMSDAAGRDASEAARRVP